MRELKNLPIGVQTFRKIRENNYIYIDKTEYIYKMVKDPFGVYFLSRPRRFGKSLLISTLNEIFLGNKELFKGLWIYDSDYEWMEYPVIKFDMSKISVRRLEYVEEDLYTAVQDGIRGYDITIKATRYNQAFKEAICTLYEKYNRKVVILIDEYDAPIISSLENTKKALKIRDILREFYRIIKSNDEYIRFAMLTGVSKFSKAGVFSALNNLKDISTHPDYSTMLGITQYELEKYFHNYITLLSQKENKSTKEILTKIKFWYNGFCFDAENPSLKKMVYNPFSTLLLFDNKSFQNYWFDSGTPKFLIDLIIKNEYDVSELDELKSTLEVFNSYEPDNLDIIPLLFQTGYISLKKR